MDYRRWRPNKTQLRALYDLYKNSSYSREVSFLAFRRTARKMLMEDCLLVPFCGMIVGIETDGYTHS